MAQSLQNNQSLSRSRGFNSYSVFTNCSIKSIKTCWIISRNCSSMLKITKAFRKLCLIFEKIVWKEQNSIQKVNFRPSKWWNITAFWHVRSFDILFVWIMQFWRSLRLQITQIRVTFKHLCGINLNKKNWHFLHWFCIIQTSKPRRDFNRMVLL